MLAGPFAPAQFARGTIVAEMGMFLVGAYYLAAWRRVSKNPQPPLISGPSLPLEKQPWLELRFLAWGITVSVAFFVLAGAADGRSGWPIVMGLCAALCFAMFAVGFISLFFLWKELALQLRRTRMSSLVLFFPLAVFWLLLGLAVLILMGEILSNLSALPEAVKREVLWTLLGGALYGLWTGRSKTALMLRAVLLVLFSSIVVVAAGFAYWWIVRKTTLLLVLFLSAIGIANAVFYSRWVRPRALQDMLVNVTGPAE